MYRQPGLAYVAERVPCEPRARAKAIDGQDPDFFQYNIRSFYPGLGRNLPQNSNAKVFVLNTCRSQWVTRRYKLYTCLILDTLQKTVRPRRIQVFIVQNNGEKRPSGMPTVSIIILTNHVYIITTLTYKVRLHHYQYKLRLHYIYTRQDDNYM